MREQENKGNLEIAQALKEFEEKSKSETGNYKAVKFYNETDTPKMIQRVMKWSGGTIKKEQHAVYLLLAIVVLMFAVSFYLFFGINNKLSRPSSLILEQIKKIPVHVNQ